MRVYRKVKNKEEMRGIGSIEIWKTPDNIDYIVFHGGCRFYTVCSRTTENTFGWDYEKHRIVKKGEITKMSNGIKFGKTYREIVAWLKKEGCKKNDSQRGNHLALK